ncbi:MAG TPA: ADP-ribosylglycohydrolase family protein [candidate division Zixibacteria bacterium]|nr:ADP-ribosylglycohydrolase family protein [candidate division Zixibacteria bacterium]
MFGAIAGDIVGSVYERNGTKTTEFPLFRSGSKFTDDTVLSVAVAEAIINGRPYGEAIREYARKYPYAGYGHSFYIWAQSDDSQPYYSWGNGSAMRVSPVGFAFDTQEMVLLEAGRSAEVTHNHPEGIKGAQATALSVYLARQGADKPTIKKEMVDRFGYDLNRSLGDIRPTYQFDVSCQGSVPESIIAFLESESIEDAIRKAISLGGDSDTMASIAGGIAEAYYGPLPAPLASDVRRRLPEEFLRIIDDFYRLFC